MSTLNIACLLSPMVDTEGPMEVVGGTTLTCAKKILGKYVEVGLEAAITFGEEHADQTHLDLLSVGKAKEVQTQQQSAIAMIQPKKHPATLGVHALERDDIDSLDAFAVADLLAGMIGQLESQPHIILTGRESWDYSHGVVGPAVAQKLGMPYYSGVNEVSINDDKASVTATFIDGNDKLVYSIALPAVFGTTDWLNGKDSARFTSLKGVMMAKKFKRNIMGDAGEAENKTTISAISEIKSERKNQVLQGDEGPNLARQAFDILVNKDKTLDLGGTADDSGNAGSVSTSWSDGDAAGLGLASDVVVLADHDGSSIRLSTSQALSQARIVADALGTKVSLLVLAENAAALASGCAGFGADRVVALEDAAFKHPTCENYVAAINGILPSGAACFMTVANDLGRDVSAYLASSFGTGLLQDISSLGVNGGKLSGSRVVSNARFTCEENITVDGPQVVSVRATSFDPVAYAGEVSFFLLSGGAPGDLRASLVEVVAGEKTKGVPLNEAKIIVSGGRGMKAAENFKKLEELADLLGAAVGASRAVTDLDWVPHNLQIGQTGTMVAPNVYFAVGISGAIQHLTGMMSSKYIVAVNPDADAPIHKHADISIIEKWENVIPTLTEEVRKAVG